MHRHINFFKNYESKRFINPQPHRGPHSPYSKILYYFDMGWRLGISHYVRLEDMLAFFSMRTYLEKYAKQRRKSTVSVETSLGLESHVNFRQRGHCFRRNFSS